MAEVDGASSICYFNCQRQSRDQSCHIFSFSMFTECEWVKSAIFFFPLWQKKGSLSFTHVDYRQKKNNIFLTTLATFIFLSTLSLSWKKNTIKMFDKIYRSQAEITKMQSYFLQNTVDCIQKSKIDIISAKT